MRPSGRGGDAVRYPVQARDLDEARVLGRRQDGRQSILRSANDERRNDGGNEHVFDHV